jgi:hypothetical protein
MQTRLRPARLAIAGLAALISAGDPVGATNRRSQGSVECIGNAQPASRPWRSFRLHSWRITVAASAGDQAALMLLRKDST